ncbi:hypothetical protein IscW_ISCW005429 [Ixodes scapularis]|uniref:Uncharacterized protein n=1 Tax=Ixodes scapularis TaxID=6945 RepID=B7PP74_IXOSC|nr:hypothetical protein IscW_ISCW005429 [Ixodes scapularis]|eukprot:XP_002435566.1 hypothetical protein IscW_ISCW005429 [Ixodes scapularis]
MADTRNKVGGPGNVVTRILYHSNLTHNVVKRQVGKALNNVRALGTCKSRTTVSTWQLQFAPQCFPTSPVFRQSPLAFGHMQNKLQARFPIGLEATQRLAWRRQLL